MFANINLESASCVNFDTDLTSKILYFSEIVVKRKKISTRFENKEAEKKNYKF